MLHTSEKLEHSNPCAMPSISPTVSLRSTDSSLSSCSDFSVDANSDGRGYLEECGTDSSQEDSSYDLKQHLNGLGTTTQLNGVCRDTDSVGTVQSKEAGDRSLKRVGSSLDEETGTSPYNDEMNAHFWIPPEPEDFEDEVEGSVANYDDDDECGDGVTWGKPTSLSSFGEEGGGRHKLKEEKQKAMEEVMNGRFKTLVDQLLKSVGVLSLGKDGDSWVDIVTSLSWEAATFVKPDAIEGNAMDPDGYVKIKCVATGLPSQSRVIKGLVFKKHAAHKHMPTKYKNPRLLLMQGALGLSPSGLSSFESMQQEKDSLKAIIDVIEMYQPNVVLVEKTVSRDIQESILAKGMTLVLDMKLHRLERVARCTGSPILSLDILVGQKLRQCDSFHFEKFVEDHASLGEGGKRPSKTLMFLEGCPTRLGCTILLMGTNSDQLKRIKCVVRCAVVMAYHFILETYFLLDEKAMFSTIPLCQVENLALTTQELSAVGAGDATSCNGDHVAESGATCTVDIPISNGYHKECPQYVSPKPEANPSFSFEPYNPVILSGFSSLSASLKSLMEDSFPIFSNSRQTMSTYFGFDEKKQDGQDQTDVQVTISLEAVDQYETEPKVTMDEEKEQDNLHPNSPSTSKNAPLDTQNSNGDYEEHMHNKDDIRAVLDSESILVLMSSRNASRGTMCDHSHFSHIKFYRNFDVPLGKFLRDNLLNQKLQCKTCGEPPEAHFYYHAHHNKQLTIQVRHLPMDKSLPGETEGKLWMWSRCGKCKSDNGSSRSTKRVLISTAARGLSFGKFLELSFSNPSSFSTKSNCGHSLHRDFLYFFGLGPMVAVFKYSKVATYSVALPPQMLEFGNSIKEKFLKKEFENVYIKGILMFADVEKSLKEIHSRSFGVSLNLQGSTKEFSDIEDILKQERWQFEVDIQNAVKNGDEAVYTFLRLNRVRLELLLESFVWGRRLHSLNSSDISAPDVRIKGNGVSRQSYMDAAQLEDDGKVIAIEDGENASYSDPKVEHKLAPSEEANDFLIKEIPIDGLGQGSRERDGLLSLSATEDIIRRISENVSVTEHSLMETGDSLQDIPPSLGRVQSDKIYPITTDIGGSNVDSKDSRSAKFQFRSNIENDEASIWTPFSEIQQDYFKDLWRGYLPKFESVGSLPLDTTAYKLITDEGSRLHIPLGKDDFIVSDYEDEFSSIIACALALLKDLPLPAQDLEEDARKEKGMDSRTNENSQSLPRIFSLNSPHWSSSGSLDSDGIHSSPSMTFEESHFSSFNGLDLLDSLVSLGAVHPELSMGIGKSPGKRKYSVVCLYASQFRHLRSRCCPSEFDYIASLSRCRNWDAKGGKSKSFFAKTLDDRFIIKEIKRTEFESFMKFAPNFFDYMNQCYERGNQTCLAKILGIYQVTIRQPKSGKETRHDLMVMENLSFSRSISRQYDLKGALHARFTSAGNGAGDVLLDQNFVNDMNVSPLYVSRKSKRNLQRAVWNDTTFLKSINVMDYSLLVGVDEQKRELVCGIIDYLRQYTWDKQLENWVKSSLVVPRNQLPTVISPGEYKKRFRKFIDTHFLSVPERWCSQRSSNPCRLCGMGDDDNDCSHLNSQEQEENDDECNHSKPQKEGEHEDSAHSRQEKQNDFSA